MKRLDLLILNLCFLPSYFWYWRRVSAGGEESLSLVLVVACLASARAMEKCEERRRVDWFSVMGAGIYVALWLLGMPAMIKAGVVILTLLYTTGAVRWVGVSGLAFLSLPWMSSFQFFLGRPLRMVVAEGASVVLNVVGVPVYAEGTGLAFKGSQVFVDPPCSGVRMMWAILVLAAVLCVIFRSGWLTGGMTFMCALMLAVVGNIIRVVILFFPEAKLVVWPEWSHDAVGVVAYVCVCVALFLSLRLMTYEPKKTINYYVSC